MLAQGGFTFSYREREIQGYDYDKRFVGKYSYKYAWIAGWWMSQSGRGCYAYSVPMELRTDWTFHHPWVIVDDFTEASFLSQRKPIMVQQQRGCWWAVELSNNPEPTMVIPKLSINPPRAKVSRYDRYNLEIDNPSLIARQLLSLSLETWAAISNRRVASSIARYARSAAQWITDNPYDPDDPEQNPWLDPWDALLAWKLRLVAGEVFLLD